MIVCSFLREPMRVCYNKLWKMLIDRRMNRVDLRESAQISTVTLAKLGKDQKVSKLTLEKICSALDCKIKDILEYLPDDAEYIPPIFSRKKQRNHKG